MSALAKSGVPSRGRPFDEAFRALLAVIVFWSFSALAATGELTPAVVVAVYILLGVAWIGEKRFPLSKRAWLGIIAAFILIDGWVFLNVERTDALVALFIFLLINKVWSAKKSRDILQILVLCFFFVLAASVMTVGISFLLFFVVFFFLLVIGLIFLTIRRERDRLAAMGIGGQMAGGPAGKIPKSFYARALGLVTLALCLTTAVFFLFPRFSKQNYIPGLGSLDTLARSGFGRSISLGAVSDIATDTSDVLRIQVEDRSNRVPRPFPGVYLRGTTLERYRRGRWSENPGVHPIRRVRTYEAHLSYSSGLQAVRPRDEDGKRLPEDILSRFHTVVQKVFLTPNARSRLFALEGVARYRFEMTHTPLLEIDEFSNTAAARGSGNIVLTYEALSLVKPEDLGDPDRPPEGIALSQTTFPLVWPKPYLETPETPRSGELAALARSIVEDAKAETRYEAIKAVETYLRNGYEYTTSGLDFGGECPTEAFLLDRKRGHCEDFASAMTLLLRHLDIPCRIVNGYYSDRWNEIGEDFLVRQADAHSWVEVHFDRVGWMAFDPSPSGSIVRTDSRFGSWTRTAKWLDAIKMKWHLNVIDYDYSRWTEFIAETGVFSPGLWARLSRWTQGTFAWLSAAASVRASGGTGPVVAVGLAAAVAVFLGLTLGAKAGRGGRGEKKTSRRKALSRRQVRSYERILHTLARRGLPKPPASTPREHARHVESLRTDLWGFSALTERYYAARYNETPLTKKDERRFESFHALARKTAKYL